MGKVKFVILAAIILLVQTGTGHGIIKVNDQAQIKHVSAADDCDWPMFGRTPDGNRVVPDGCGFKGSTPKKLWQFKTSQFFDIAPVISNKKVFFGDWNNKFYCLDEVNGELIWTFNVDGYVDKPACVYEDKVYFGSWDKNMYCLDVSTGKEIWTFKTENQITCSPLAINGCVYFGGGYGDNRIYCLDAKTGKEKWQYKTNNRIDCAPVFFKSNIYIASYDGNLYCLDAVSGKEIWLFKTGDVIQESLTIAYGLVYLGSSDKKFYCLNPDNGSVVWVFSAGDGIYFSSVIWKNKVYFTCFNNDLFCLNAQTGKQIWVQRLKEGFDGTPTISDGKLYLGSGYEFKLLCVDANNGKRIWDYDCHVIESSPVICSGRIYITLTSGYLVCLGNENDYIAWPTKIEVTSTLTKLDSCQSANLTAKVFDQNNQEIKDAKVVWSVEPKDISTIDEMGIFKPSKLGVATITCKCGDISAFVVVNVVDPIFVDTEGIRIDILKPFEKVSKKFTLTNNGDLPKDIILSSSIGTVAVNPSSLTLAAGESREIEVSSQINQIEPIPDTEFTITITNGSCIKQVKGILTQGFRLDNRTAPKLLK